jgi:phytoene dehydrogenase-like protein
VPLPEPAGADAVVVGAGPNGLVAANLLADAGWSVVVVEAEDEPGGGVRSAPGPHPDFLSDLCSAFYPLAAASPAIGALRLDEHGLRWRHAPAVLGHPLLDGRCAVLRRDLDHTLAGLDGFAPGDGAAWRRLFGLWERVGDPLLQALFTPSPPVRATARLASRLGPGGLLRFARFALLPVRRLAEEEFRGEGGPLLLAGCALHADLMPESAGSGIYGWLLAMLGQQVGFPVPAGGAGRLTAALVRRLESRGGMLRCGQPVTEVVVRRGRAAAVRTADGTEIVARRAVLADVVATRLYGGLVAWEHLPARLRADLRRFQWDFSTFKVDWALSGPVPWSAPAAGEGGTVHVAASLDEMTDYAGQLARGVVPDRPFLLVGQMTTADGSRSPQGTESLWGYTHVPRQVRGDAGRELSGDWPAGDVERFADRMEAQLERFAPGFRQRVLGRRVSSPGTLQAHNRNLVGGAINGGTSAAHQQLVFRPTPGLGRPETPVTGLYLASSSAHPGGGVHGACGANAARAALRGHRLRTQAVGSWAVRAVTRDRRSPVRAAPGHPEPPLP